MCVLENRDETIAQDVDVLPTRLDSVDAFVERGCDRIVRGVRVLVPVRGHRFDAQNFIGGKTPAVIVQLGGSTEGAVDVEDHKHGGNSQ